jgi:hypothetical protein
MLDRSACDAYCLRCLGCGAQSFLGILPHAYFVLIRRPQSFARRS